MTVPLFLFRLCWVWQLLANLCMVPWEAAALMAKVSPRRDNSMTVNSYSWRLRISLKQLRRLPMVTAHGGPFIRCNLQSKIAAHQHPDNGTVWYRLMDL